MYKAKHFLFRTLLLFSIAALLVVVCQFRLSATLSNSYEWSKTAKWSILSTHFHDGLIRIGYADPLGNSIPPSLGGDVVRPMVLVGYMDRNGKQLIPPRFFHARDFSEGLAVVRVDPKRRYHNVGWDKKVWDFGYIDRSGNVKIEPQFASAHDFSNGLAEVYIEGKGSGYIDHQGKMIIKPTNRFMSLYSFHEGRAIVYPKNPVAKCYFIDKQGRLIRPQDKNLVCNENLENDHGFSEGLLVVVKNNKYGYVDINGKLVIDTRFDGAQNFSEGVAKVLLKGKNGQYVTKYINKQGQYVLELKADIKEGFSFKEGLALAQDYHTKKYGFLDKKGLFRVPPIFDNDQTEHLTTGIFESDNRILSKGFSEGVSRAFHNGKYIFINTSGKELFSPEKISKFGVIKGLRSFSEGLAFVESEPTNSIAIADWHRFFVDKYGNVAIQQPK